MPYRETIHYNRNGGWSDFYQSQLDYWKREPASEEQSLALLYSGLYSSHVFGHQEGQHLIGDFTRDGKDDVAFYEPGDNQSWGANSMYIEVATSNGLWHPFPGWIYDGQEPTFGRLPWPVSSNGDFNGDGEERLRLSGARAHGSVERLPLSVSTLLRDPSAPPFGWSKLSNRAGASQMTLGERVFFLGNARFTD